jgi:hypothetical protein
MVRNAARSWLPLVLAVLVRREHTSERRAIDDRHPECRRGHDDRESRQWNSGGQQSGRSTSKPGPGMRRRLLLCIEERDQVMDMPRLKLLAGLFQSRASRRLPGRSNPEYILA